MVNEPTHERLLQLGLNAMAVAWRNQQADAEYSSMPFDERLGLIIDAEWLMRENKRIKRRLAEAKLKITSACFEGIDFPPTRKLDKPLTRQLGTCRWIAEHQNCVITGKTGTGKSYVACALAHQACMRGYRAMYRRATRLFEELTLAHADGTYGRLLQKFARVDVLVIDDWGLAPVQDTERRDLLEILEDREPPQVVRTVAGNDGQPRVQQVVGLLEQAAVVDGHRLHRLGGLMLEGTRVHAVQHQGEGAVAEEVAVDFQLGQ